ncbi:unnamed protein product [Urochloa humidicola]
MLITTPIQFMLETVNGMQLLSSLGYLFTSLLKLYVLTVVVYVGDRKWDATAFKLGLLVHFPAQGNIDAA